MPRDTRATRKSGITRASAKAKGRRAVQRVQALLLAAFRHLGVADVWVKAGAQTGVDLHLSEAAQRAFPYSIEAKAVEALNIWAALAQAAANASPEKPGILFFQRNGSPMYVALDAEVFLKAISSDREDTENTCNDAAPKRAGA